MDDVGDDVDDDDKDDAAHTHRQTHTRRTPITQQKRVQCLVGPKHSKILKYLRTHRMLVVGAVVVVELGLQSTRTLFRRLDLGPLHTHTANTTTVTMK